MVLNRFKQEIDSNAFFHRFVDLTCKEILGRIRSKFSELPIPDATVTLDGETLVAEAQSEKEQLYEYLKEELEKVDVGNMIEGDANNAENINRQLSYNPMGIYTFGGG